MEKTPRPKTSLRHDFVVSSQEHSGGEQSETSGEKDASAETLKKNDTSNAEEHPGENKPVEKKQLFSAERRAKNLELIGSRAKERSKEQSEALEILFECTAAKAIAIDQSLKALGPGCRLHEAPALVACELSGIPVNTYKGLASGQLVATMPPNAVRHVGTDTAGLAPEARSIGTETKDLPANEVTAPPAMVTETVGTDTTNIPTHSSTTSSWSVIA